MTQSACKWSKETAKQNQILEISFGLIGRDGLEDLTKLDNDNVYGNASYKGWCNLDAEDVYEAKVPLKTPYCDCRYDGVVGSLCEQPTECTCINQCSNNGFCQNGFCAVSPLTSCGLIDAWCSRLNQCNSLYNSVVACSIIFVDCVLILSLGNLQCNKGWYGVDCSVPSSLASPRHWPRWLRPSTLNITTENVEDDMVTAVVEKKRPLIYIYDLPPEFNAHMLQVIHSHWHPTSCVILKRTCAMIVGSTMSTSCNSNIASILRIEQNSQSLHISCCTLVFQWSTFNPSLGW